MNALAAGRQPRRGAGLRAVPGEGGLGRPPAGRALAAGYLGDPVLVGYAAAAQIDELRPSALRRLAAALSWTPGPWCPHHF